MTTLHLDDVCCRTYALEIPIAGSRERVWTALTEELSAWWLPDFHVVGPDSVVTLDARAGGALLERRTDGGSLLWYTVQMAVPNESLDLVGHLGKDWGGPATTMLTLRLEARGDETVLHVRDCLVGRTTEESCATQAEGWRTLFTDGLKAHVEG